MQYPIQNYRKIVLLLFIGILSAGCASNTTHTPSTKTSSLPTTTITSTPISLTTSTITPQIISNLPDMSATASATALPEITLQVLRPDNADKMELLPIGLEAVPAPLTSSWSPDGNIIAIGTEKRLFLLDPEGNPIYQRPVTYGIQAMAFSPDSKLFAFADGHNVYYFPLGYPGKEKLVSGQNQTVLSLVFDPAGNLLASAGESNRIVIWDVSSPTNATVLQDSSSIIRGLVFSSDSSFLFSSSDKGSIMKWRLETQTIEREMTCECSATTRLLMISSLLFAGTVEGWIQVVDPDTGELLQKYDTATGSIQSLVADGLRKAIVWSGIDGRIGIIEDYERREYRTIPLEMGIIRSVSLAPDGDTLVATGSNHSVVTLKTRTGAWLKTLYSGLPSNISNFTFDPQGNYIYWKGGGFGLESLYRWNLLQSVYEVVAPSSNLIGKWNEIPWTFLPEDKLLFYTGDTYTPMGIVDLVTGNAETIPDTAKDEVITDTSSDPTGKYLCWRAANGIYGFGGQRKPDTLYLMDLERRTIIHQWSYPADWKERNYWPEYQKLIMYSKDIIFSAGPDGLIRFTTQEETPETISNLGFYDIRLSNDGTILAAVVAYPSPYKVQGHIEFFAISDDGRNIVRTQRVVGEEVSIGPNNDLVATVYGGKIQILDAKDFHVLRAISIPGVSIRHALFSPTGNRLAAFGKNGIIFWGVFPAIS